MSCCNHDCRQGRTCPADKDLADMLFAGLLYAISAAALVILAWVGAWAFVHI